MNIETPWINSFGEVPHNLEYPDCSMAALVSKAAEAFPDTIAYDFFGSRLSYKDFYAEICRCAAGLLATGIKIGDRVTICMPNTPQAVIMLYALNLIGAVANMVHPLSASEELVRYIVNSRSVAVLTLDQFSKKLIELLPRTPAKTLILSGIDDGLIGIKKPLYKLTQGRKIKRTASSGAILRYADLLKRGQDYTAMHNTAISGALAPDTFAPNTSASDNTTAPNGTMRNLAAPDITTLDAGTRGDDVAVILYSGGTSGTTKGILLTNLNFNALAMQTVAAGNCVQPRRRMLAIMPIFHGFGLGVCIHTAFISGITAILVPQFSIKSYAQLLNKYKPHYIAGVPTLFEALLRLDNIDNLDLSQLMGVFSGGDSLSIELKRKVDLFLRTHGASVQVREGYGLTECVTASCLTPRDFHKEGSIGIPYPDTYYKIISRKITEALPYKSDSPESHTLGSNSLDSPKYEALPYGEEGEITLSGPTVMKGYDGNDEETKQTLRVHPDGRVWLHTGDLGMMDTDGFVYFKQRIKRMIISSGYSVYPSQLENILEAHESVLISCVIGVPDDYKMQRIKAYIVLHGGMEPTDEIKASILEHCRRNIAKYAMPSEFEYREDLPRTLVGKVAYIELEKEATKAQE